MAGARKCCCDSCICPDGTKISSDGTVEWITHTVDSGVITVVDHEGPCITYWVDSDAGDQTETGDGTELDPWININTVFADACIKHICTHQDSPDGCPKVKILTKGTIDYTVNGGSYNYGRNLIFEPWGIAAIIIGVSGTGNVYGITSCIGVIWKNTNATGTSTDLYGYGFLSCTLSIFDNCIGSGTSTANDYSFGFSYCGSVFNNCDGEGTGGRSVGFGYCQGSFKNCNGTASGSTGWAFDNCENSTFDSCEGKGVSSGASVCTGIGFQNCDGSTFIDCNGSGEGSGSNQSKGIGFSSCGNSILTNCTGLGTSNGSGTTSYAFGFAQNGGSTFNSCDGTGSANGSPTYIFGCGFYQNTLSSFNSCTTSTKICAGTPDTCNWSCDI